MSACSSSRSRKTGRAAVLAGLGLGLAQPGHLVGLGGHVELAGALEVAVDRRVGGDGGLDGVEVLAPEPLQGVDLVGEPLDPVGQPVGEAGGTEPSVAARRRPAAAVALQQHHVARRVVLLGQQRRPQPGVATTDHHQVGPCADPTSGGAGSGADRVVEPEGQRERRRRRAAASVRWRPTYRRAGWSRSPDMLAYSCGVCAYTCKMAGSPKKVGIVGASGLRRRRAAASVRRAPRSRGGGGPGRVERRPVGRRPHPVAGRRLSRPGLQRRPTPPPSTGSTWSSCALPHGQSQTLVPDLVDRVGVVVDLAADFRLRDPAALPDLVRRGAPGARAARHVRLRAARAPPRRAGRRHPYRRARAAIRRRPCWPWPRWSRPGRWP